MRTVCIIQARMGSTRLPGKILKSLLDKPLLWWVVYRVRQSRLIDDIVIATTTLERDDVIVDLCKEENWAFSRGSEDDVLDRYYQAAKQNSANIVVRITSDCPLIDPDVVDYSVASYKSVSPSVDYAAVFPVRTYPRGLDTEVFSIEALTRAWNEDTSQWREHVTPYIHQQPDKFQLFNVTNPIDYSHHRWTVDTPEDFELVRRIYDHFGHSDFSWQEVLALLEEHPEWVKINQNVEQKKL